MKGRLILTLGGSRSGKSEFAEKIAGLLGERVVYIATAAVLDGEMAERVRLHRARRPLTWETVEEEKNILDVLERGREGDVFLIDCAAVWITNLLLDRDLPRPGAGWGEKEVYITEQLNSLADAVKKGVHLVIVSSEAGMGIVPEHPFGRLFRDVLGKANQLLAAKADRVFFVVAGLPLELKSLSEVMLKDK